MNSNSGRYSNEASNFTFERTAGSHTLAGGRSTCALDLMTVT